MAKKQKAQQEILGFVLIVLIVTIIGIVLLAMSLGRDKMNKQNSVEISNLLEASMYYTTDCATNYAPYYLEVQDLIKQCESDKDNNKKKCLKINKTVCPALNMTLKKIIEDNLDVGEDAVNKAYKLKIYYESFSNEESQENNTILYLEKGVFDRCSSIPGGSHTITMSSFSSGVIVVELELCAGGKEEG